VGQEFIDINEDGHPDVVDSKPTLETLRSIVPEEVPIVVESAKANLGPVPTEEPALDDVEVDIPTELARP